MPKRDESVNAGRRCRLLVPAALLAFTATAFATPTPPAHSAPATRSFKDWTATCPTADTQHPLCFIMQNLALKKTGKRILSVRVGPLSGNGQPMLLVTVPLGVFLPAGIELSIDGANAKRVDYQFCNAEGCSAVIALSPGALERLKAGRQARVVFEDARERPISVPVSLLGFTAAYAHISR